MFDIMQLLTGSAAAQTTSSPVSPPGGSGTSVFMNFLPLFLIFAVFYVLIIRPQQKKMNEQARMIKALRRGDRVITSGGIHGKISKLEGDDILVLEIADGVNIKVARPFVTGLEAKTTPTITNDGDDAEKKN